ncbi:MAG: serine/threonine-protein phosphatase [Lentisphaerae bacterium]|nr:serine/threonine-protein phosphatase [Lentisphaerota bacterium]
MNRNFAELEIAGESNIGTIRHHNEDNFLIFAPPGGSAVLAVVADGIGGHSRGEVASFICCRELFLAAKQLDSSCWDKKFLLDTLQGANDRIFNFNYRGRRVKPMGCTVVAAIFTRDTVICASAGDSRMYEFFRAPGQKPLRQITTDHRPQGYDDLKNGNMFRYTNLISRSLGTAKYLQIDTHEFPRRPKAKYRLCSDGLYNRKPEQVLAGVLGSDLTVRQTVSSLLRETLLSGERDNITVICAADAKKENMDHASA